MSVKLYSVATTSSAIPNAKAGYRRSNPFIPNKAPVVCSTFGIYPVKAKPIPAANPATD